MFVRREAGERPRKTNERTSSLETLYVKHLRIPTYVAQRNIYILYRKKG